MTDRLAIIARDSSGTVISRAHVAADRGKQPLQGVMGIARNMLRIKGCVRTEIHSFESEQATYEGIPLAVVRLEDLFWGNPSPSGSAKEA
jgi:hypothetical protein